MSVILNIGAAIVKNVRPETVCVGLIRTVSRCEGVF